MLSSLSTLVANFGGWYALALKVLAALGFVAAANMTILYAS